MNDLGRQLERRSERFEYEQGALDRVFDRRRKLQSRRRLVAGALALVIATSGTLVALWAFGGNAPKPAVEPPPPTVVPSIPDGTYWTKPVTRAEVTSVLTDAGFSHREAKKYYFNALTIPFDRWIRQGLVIQDGFWFQTARNASGADEAGWGGDFVVTGPRTLRASDNVCAITYRFTVSGGVLRLRVIRDVGPRTECGTADLVAQTAIYDAAPFLREP
jgi:hypothetical protein